VINDAVKNDAVKNDAVKNDAVKNDAAKNDAVTAVTAVTADSGAAGGGFPIGDDALWRRVSPKYVAVDVVGYIIFAAVVVGVGSLVAYLTQVLVVWIAVAIIAAIFVVVIAFTPRRVRSIGYQLRSDDLLFCRGILFSRVVAVPYGRMQLVDINRGPLDRMLGLSELRFVTAAASSGVVIPGLLEADAEELRDALVSLAESRRAGL
jgi:membrane protein YdbS with pleckstrin-like domain